MTFEELCSLIRAGFQVGRAIYKLIAYFVTLNQRVHALEDRIHKLEKPKKRRKSG